MIFLIKDVKEDIKNIENIRFRMDPYNKDGYHLLLNYDSPIDSKLTTITILIEDSYKEDKKLFIKYVDILFPEMNVNDSHNIDDFEKFYADLFPYMEVEHDNLNRVHFITIFPRFLRNLKLGTKIYLNLVNSKYYISSINSQRELDAELVWDSIRQNETIYTFINDQRIISFKLDINLGLLDSDKSHSETSPLFDPEINTFLGFFALL